MYQNWIVNMIATGDVWQVTTGNPTVQDGKDMAIKQLSEALGREIDPKEIRIAEVGNHFPSSVVKLFDGCGCWHGTSWSPHP